MALPFGAALLANLLATPLIRLAAVKMGRVAGTRPDRWHRQPTPTMGGVGIFLAFGLSMLLGFSFASTNQLAAWGFLSGSVLVFLVGIYDEFHALTPTAKLVAQILAATLVISLGNTSTFFTPRIDNPHIAQVFNILFTYIWLVGITNALNLLDNMDGLAGGIALIAALVLGYFFWDAGNISLLWVSLALAGALLGFLVYNFPPARIFMGDSGSLFLGFTLAGLAIAQQQQASNLFAVVGVPALIFLLPIMDTLLVTFTRLLRGESPARGGRDHTSHRLVAFGMSERQAILVLYALALFSGIAAALLESINYWLSLALAPVAVIGLGLLTAYLGQIRVVAEDSNMPHGRTIARLMLDLTYRRRLLEVILDFFLVGIAYYLTFLVLHQLTMTPADLGLFLDSLPVVLAGTFLVSTIVGVYRVLWRFSSYDDVLRYALAAFGSAGLCAGVIYALDLANLAAWGEAYRFSALVYYGAFLFIGLAVSRSSFRLMDTLLRGRRRSGQTSALIIGAGDSGEMALRWVLMNPSLNIHPLGFIDPDPLLTGRGIHGIRVLGSLESLQVLLKRSGADGIILAADGLSADSIRQIKTISQQQGCWLRRLRLEFELLNDLETEESKEDR